MAQPDPPPPVRDLIARRPRTDVMTGGADPAGHLLYQLGGSLRTASRIDIIVSFLMESGVKLILADLESALARGARIRILTGDYLGITQPSALYLIRRKLGERADLRFYSERRRSFHPKSYIFHHEGFSEIFIGSSNISESALTSGIEWNYRFTSLSDPRGFSGFYSAFEDLFENHSLKIDGAVLARYSKNWKRPAVYRDIERLALAEAGAGKTGAFEPRGAQIEALCALETTRSEGAGRALVQAATGVGKTFIAAFDSRDFRRVLFVAHRREILRQAAETFRNVRGPDSYGFFDGENRVMGRSVLFASVSTLGRPEYLNPGCYPPDWFDYVVIDECHHAVGKLYANIAAYFRPKFLLGLTATPERLDGKDALAICDWNVPYEITLKDAINRGLLAPFRYWGIYDETDYSGFRPVRGRYREEDLDAAYLGNAARNDLVFRSFSKHGPKRALGFCSSRAHAEEMARVFSERGVPAAAVYSGADGEFSEERGEAVRKLEDGEIRAIFSVDMFNEGVDIPSVDMVMFLRPTESPTVFLQQLGRGLRKSPGKEYLAVLDFIGNYEKAGRTRFLLAGDGRRAACALPAMRLDLPEGCLADFDLKLIDLFAEMEKNRMKVKDRVRAEYLRVRDTLGRRPSRVELFTAMDDEVYELAASRPAANIFRGWLEFLEGEGDLAPDEAALLHGPGREFLSLVASTSMTKVYKMPVLTAFLDRGKVRAAVTEKELLASWKEFFSAGTRWKDLEGVESYSAFLETGDRAHMKRIMKMPVHFLIASGKGFFVEREGFALALRDEIAALSGLPAFAREFGDVVAWRAMDYYRRRYRESRWPETGRQSR